MRDRVARALALARVFFQAWKSFWLLGNDAAGCRRNSGRLRRNVLQCLQHVGKHRLGDEVIAGLCKVSIVDKVRLSGSPED